MQRERRSQVEPRCAERWHLRDDEQFDLAAWFLSLEYSWSRVGQLLFYFDISLSIKLLLVSASRGCNEMENSRDWYLFHLLAGSIFGLDYYIDKVKQLMKG